MDYTVSPRMRQYLVEPVLDRKSTFFVNHEIIGIVGG